ncbi:hypothetical protein [Aquibacillus rhizosphaerae]|uniref:Uncharacterized protein n=1 Tax=Aquibacillus rhizosphaerae TaxID=3051431 RepID=A0ABT7LB17_9BACI|nr:hypothetical protein [Aquibacillus sp. LR5S19]MDL4843059.1 hypothetical protein [Aquibacillus sp. LR5S19]
MKAKEVLLWSIALPGFGQILNQKYIKGIVFIGLEFLVNVQANFNEVIRFSFLGETHLALAQTDFGWLMFYPCLYFFAMWDAFYDAGGGKGAYDFLPFVFSAYFVTVGLMYASKVKLFGVLLGPVWLPMLSVIPGVVIGFILKKIIYKLK